MRFPDVVIQPIDHAVEVAVGGQVWPGLTERVAPHRVVGRVDDPVVVCVAGIDLVCKYDMIWIERANRAVVNEDRAGVFGAH